MVVGVASACVCVYVGGGVDVWRGWVRGVCVCVPVVVGLLLRVCPVRVRPVWLCGCCFCVVSASPLLPPGLTLPPAGSLRAAALHAARWGYADL